MRFDRLIFPLLYKRNKNIYSSSILTIIFLMIISVIIIFFDTQNLIKSSVVRNKVLNIMFLNIWGPGGPLFCYGKAGCLPEPGRGACAPYFFKYYLNIWGPGCPLF